MSKKWLSLYFVLFTLPLFITTVAADIRDVDVSGYVQNGSGNRLDKSKKIKHDASNKLRLELKSNINGKMSFGANINFVDYYGETCRNLWDWVPDSETVGLPADDYNTHVMNFEDKVYLNDLFIKYEGDRFSLTVGKQQLVMGVGYAYNPLDVLNVKNIMDPAYEPSGHSGFRFDYSLGRHSSIMMFYSQKEFLKDSTKLIKLDNTFDSFTFSFIAGESMWTFTDYYVMTDKDVNRRFIGADIKKNIFGLDLWSEVMYNRMEDSENYEEAVFGAGKSFGGRAEIVVEYYRYGLGDTDSRDFDINDWFGYFFGQKKAMSRDTSFCKFSFRVNDHFTFEPSISHSINDGSFRLSPNCSFPVNENLKFDLATGITGTKEAKANNFYGGTGFMLLSRYSF